MREIKFRAWDYLQGEMIDSDSLAFEEYTPIKDLLKDTDLQVFMQFTGLKDSNGTEIYEGDILFEEDENYIGIVEFKNSGFMTDARGFGDEYLGGGGCYKVIGNIYENPELLESK